MLEEVTGHQCLPGRIRQQKRKELRHPLACEAHNVQLQLQGQYMETIRSRRLEKSLEHQVYMYLLLLEHFDRRENTPPSTITSETYQSQPVDQNQANIHTWILVAIIAAIPS